MQMAGCICLWVQDRVSAGLTQVKSQVGIGLTWRTVRSG